ncbi:MAG: DNA damage-inducible protein D [Alkaliphilus sp.]|nr:DNA damage-inducible protein D [Alkaliphilus sp.]
MSNIDKYSQKIFEDIRRITDDGIEFWYGRELQQVLEYTEWRNFSKVVDKAKIACENSKQLVSNHFVDVNNMVQLGSGAQREIEDIMLTRYACYLIVQNSDPRKEIVALGQTYFAVKTREREIEEKFEQLTEEEKRLAIRNELRGHNKSLAEAAQMAGVKTPKDYGIFQNKGYQGLYGGLGAKDIYNRKNLKGNQKILDHMGSTELAANLFRATQTDEKLRRENIRGKEKANQTHYKVGAKVRKTIEELGGTMPEDLPTPEKGIKQIEKEKNRQLKKGQ